MSIPLTYNQYYTHFSFALFIVGLALPFTSKVKYFILLNSIIVGIVGNLLIINDYQLWVEWYNENYPNTDINVINLQLLKSNFISHNLPLILSFILLPFCTSYLHSISDVLYWTIIEIISIISWSLLSYQGLLFENKIDVIYPNKQFLFNSLILSCLLVFGLISYLSARSSIFF